MPTQVKQRLSYYRPSAILDLWWRHCIQ